LSNSFRHFLSSIEKTMNWLQELAKLSVRFFPKWGDYQSPLVKTGGVVQNATIWKFRIVQTTCWYRINYAQLYIQIQALIAQQAEVWEQQWACLQARN